MKMTGIRIKRLVIQDMKTQNEHPRQVMHAFSEILKDM